MQIPFSIRERQGERGREKKRKKEGQRDPLNKSLFKHVSSGSHDALDYGSKKIKKSLAAKRIPRPKKKFLLVGHTALGCLLFTT